MTIISSGAISFNTVEQEYSGTSGFSTSLSFLDGLVTPAQRQVPPNMAEFYSKAYYQSTSNGNCNNANISNCNCSVVGGNIQCYVTNNCVAINCANCDAQKWLQTNCNCACTYNCTSNQNCFTYNCNCSKIICTKLHSLGKMAPDIFRADQEFGDLLRAKHPDMYNGYVAWAQVVVDWMSGEGPQMMLWIRDLDKRRQAQIDWSTTWAEAIATPWAEWMAHQMGERAETNNIGLALMAIGAPISWVVGKWKKLFGPRKTPAGFGTGLGLIAIFIALKTIVHIGNLFNKANKLIKSAV
jgi:hypothetical protein